MCAGGVGLILTRTRDGKLNQAGGDGGYDQHEQCREASAATVAVLSDPAIAKQFADQQFTVMALAKDRFGDLIKADSVKWEKVVKAAGIKME